MRGVVLAFVMLCGPAAFGAAWVSLSVAVPPGLPLVVTVHDTTGTLHGPLVLPWADANEGYWCRLPSGEIRLAAVDGGWQVQRFDSEWVPWSDVQAWAGLGQCWTVASGPAFAVDAVDFGDAWDTGRLTWQIVFGFLLGLCADGVFACVGMLLHFIVRESREALGG